MLKFQEEVIFTGRPVVCYNQKKKPAAKAGDAEGTGMDERLGELVKQIRKGKKWTLQDLSEATGLSISYLSLLERGRNSPTIANLQKICQSLGITFNELISSLDDDKIYIPKEQRRRIFEEGDQVLYEAVTEGNRHIKSICMTVFDNQEYDSDRHIADEFGFVVSGSMIMTVEGVAYHLRPGDSLYIPAQSRHSFRKTSDEPCVSVWSYHNISLEDEANYPTKKPK